MAQYANPDPKRMEMDTMAINSLLMTFKIENVVAPKTFLMPISFVFCSAKCADNPNKPKQVDEEGELVLGKATECDFEVVAVHDEEILAVEYKKLFLLIKYDKSFRTQGIDRIVDRSFESLKTDSYQSNQQDYCS